MTIKEFSRAYGIDYYTVYKATSKVRIDQGMYYSIDYDEKALRDAVREDVKRQARRLSRQVRKVKMILAAVGEE